MREQWHTNFNDIKGEIERFELMESGEKTFYFDVHTIENIFEFYAEKFQFEKAERILKVGILQHPDAPSLQTKQALILIEKGEDIEAIGRMEHLVKMEKSNPELFLNLGYVYLRNNRINEAVDCFKNSLSLAFEDHEETLLDIAQYLNQHEQFKYALEFLEPESKKYPLNEAILFELAYALDKENRTEEGFDAYQRLLELDPFSENAWYNLGIIYIKKENYNKAIECYDFALALNPSHAEALFNKANSLVALNRLPEAIDLYIEYLSYDYDSLLPYHYIADCYDQLNNSEMALRFYRLTVNTDPAYLPAWLNYLATLINMELIDEAEEASLKALEHHSDFIEFWYLRARVLLLSENYRGAYDALLVTITQEPDNLRNLFEFYNVERKLSPRKNPFKIIENLLKKYPEATVAHYLAVAYFLMEDRQLTRAAEHLKTALIENPYDYDLFLDLFPKMEKIIGQSKKLSAIVDQYSSYEF
ncbi:MAG: tetratricopeptide repeat protein [Bacteroidales bacterium]|jgi:tetratricopeptide (TPR) repeat protein|nr:tetratricopeptide repeat protein [Bacteroidales bacterium]